MGSQLFFFVILLLLAPFLLPSSATIAGVGSHTDGRVETRKIAVDNQDDDNIDVQHYWVFNNTANGMHYAHMSTITAMANGTLAAACQSSTIGEGCNDQSIFFSTSSTNGTTWTPHTVIASNPIYAVWGPVLYYDTNTTTLWLFYAQSNWQQNRSQENGCGAMGRSHPGGSLYYTTSLDQGISWSDPKLILAFEDEGFISKMTANPLIVTANGAWILPYWSQKNTIEDLGPQCSSVLNSVDQGVSWQSYSCLNIVPLFGGYIEPTIAQVSNGSLFQLFRTGLDVVFESWSHDGGFTWTNAEPTTVPNPDSKVCMVNIVGSNKIVLAYNPSTKNRNPLWLSYSTDGHHWDELDVLADDAKLVYGESYPTVIQMNDYLYTTYSDDSSIGIRLAVSPIPPS